MTSRTKLKLVILSAGIILYIMIGLFLLYLVYGVLHRAYFTIDSILPLACMIGLPGLLATALIAIVLDASNRRRFIKTVEIVFLLFYTILLIGVLFGGFRTFSYSHKVAFSDYVRYNCNLVPLKTIHTYIRDYIHDTINKSIIYNNLIGNILIFSPMGFFLPCIFKKQQKIFVFIITALIVLLCLEGSQLILQAGSFDVDDIILNFFGALVVFLILMLPPIKALLRRLNII